MPPSVVNPRNPRVSPSPTMNRSSTATAARFRRNIPWPSRSRRLVQILRCRHLPHHGVVGNAGKLEDHRTDCEQNQSEPQIAVVVLDEVEARHREHGDAGQYREREFTFTRRIETLSGDRSENRDEEAGDSECPAEPRSCRNRAGKVVTDRVGEIDREDEREDHCVECGRSPIPQPPCEHLTLRGRTADACGWLCLRARGLGAHTAKLTARGRLGASLRSRHTRRSMHPS